MIFRLEIFYWKKGIFKDVFTKMVIKIRGIGNKNSSDFEDPKRDFIGSIQQKRLKLIRFHLDIGISKNVFTKMLIKSLRI